MNQEKKYLHVFWPERNSKLYLRIKRWFPFSTQRYLAITVCILLIAIGLIFFHNQKTSPETLGTTTTPESNLPRDQQTASHYAVIPTQKQNQDMFSKKVPEGSKTVTGSIVSVAKDSLEVLLSTGSKITVNLSQKTIYKGGSQSDLKAGARVGGYGQEESDGSVTAAELMVNPF